MTETSVPRYLTIEQVDDMIDEGVEGVNHHLIYKTYTDKGYDPAQMFGLMLANDSSATKENIQYYLDKGVDLNKSISAVIGLSYEIGTNKDDGQIVYKPSTPLTICYATGNTNTAKLLIDMGADPNYPNQYGITPFEAILIQILPSCDDKSWMDVILSNLKEAYSIGVRPPSEFIINKDYLQLFIDYSSWFKDTLNETKNTI